MNWTGLTAWDISQLDTNMILSYFAAGFLMAAAFWGVGKAVALILKLVREA